MLMWWKNQVASNSLPILSIVAAKYLCVPGSSTKCEQVFSQGGIIDTKLRNRLKALTLELLVSLKEEWDDSLYAMSHAEKLSLLAGWRVAAEERGLGDPTDRQFGIPEEVNVDQEIDDDHGMADGDVDLELVDEDALREYEKQKDGTVGMEEDQKSDDGLGYDDDDDDLWEEDDDSLDGKD